jgi:hypothetical protein
MFGCCRERYRVIEFIRNIRIIVERLDITRSMTYQDKGRLILPRALYVRFEVPVSATPCSLVDVDCRNIQHMPEDCHVHVDDLYLSSSRLVRRCMTSIEVISFWISRVGRSVATRCLWLSCRPLKTG